MYCFVPCLVQSSQGEGSPKPLAGLDEWFEILKPCFHSFLMKGTGPDQDEQNKMCVNPEDQHKTLVEQACNDRPGCENEHVFCCSWHN